MHVWLLDYDKFVKLNHVEPVTNAIMFDAGNVPTVDGLFSTEIFGVSTKDRKDTYAYIDLGMKFLNPKVYITLLRLNRNFESVVYGSKKFRIENGLLVPDEENGGTGLKWLYTNWDKIKFPRNDSAARSERIDLLTTNSKDVLFTDKFIVIPAFYRDVNLQSADKNPRVPEINDLYAKIIRNVKVVQDANNMDFIIASVTGKIQSLLVDVYNLLKDKIQGKNGYIRKFLMGKSVDYSSRVVITAAPYNADRVEDQDVDFYHTGVPLSHCCSEFTPFIIYWTTRWFKNNLENMKNNFQVVNSKGEVQIVKLDRPETFYNSEYIEKRLNQFVKNPYTRFDKIEIPLTAETLKSLGRKGPIYIKFRGRAVSGDTSTTPKKVDADGVVIDRELTWTDLFYQAAIDATEGKHVWVTRYPVVDYMGSYTSRISVIGTRNTVPMVVDGKYYAKYPDINPDIDKRLLDSVFRDTVNICPLYLKAMVADHDGDQTTVKPVFSDEANEECERILNSKANLLTVEGKGVRDIGNEGVQTLYSMTRFH